VVLLVTMDRNCELNRATTIFFGLVRSSSPVKRESSFRVLSTESETTLTVVFVISLKIVSCSFLVFDDRMSGVHALVF